ncbi:TetR/AcrR family transcriptional regulator [Bacilliculturomica massiliensis]|uniref:TetR/AcrR family transcriptional regulator n=1 Tax=Bacilliculturomica massiliensis TaxID=1917867 RepID=UPI00103265FB|nr:TetR/AcrR family transcriptional regulator [Bacilliculturomica massiliensis]
MAQSITSEITKTRMCDALKKKMAQKPLNKITVKEIAADCGLNRQTFYYHFQDIYDMVEWMFEQEAIEMLRETVSIHTWQEACLRLFRYIEKNQDVCLCALNSMAGSHLQNFLYHSLEGLVRDVVNQAAENLDTAEKYRSFLTHYYTITFTGILVGWLRGDMPGTPDEIIEMLSIAISDNIRGATERFAEQGEVRP